MLQEKFISVAVLHYVSMTQTGTVQTVVAPAAG